jgi:ribosomal protein S18 acetylase RimI-like enzyme
MIVRQLGSEDAAVYQRLRLRALQESPTAFSASYDEEAARSPAEIEARVAPAADGSRCVLGVFADEQLGGFLAFIRPQRAKVLHWAELAGMYVAPEFRRRGFGRALLDGAIGHARSLGGIRHLKLGVNAANNAARLLYQSAGFTRFGVEPDALCVDGCYYDEESYVLRLNEAVALTVPRDHDVSPR